LLQTSIANEQGWINSRAVLDRLTAAAQEGRAPNQLWYIYVLESWLRHEQNFSAEADVSEPEEVTVLG